MNDLQKFAMASLSESYEGDSYEGDSYIGFDDAAIEFGPGVVSFVQENKNNIQFTIKINNTAANAVDRTLAIVPGYHSTAAQIVDSKGVAVDAIITEGTVVGAGGTALTANGQPKYIDEFLQFIKYNPTRIIGIKMLVSNQDQLEENIYIRESSPFRNLQDRTITPSNYKTSEQFNDLRCEIPLNNVQFDNQTVMIMKILAGRTVTLNFFIGAIRNTASELNKKATKAMSNISRGIVTPMSATQKFASLLSKLKAGK